MPLGDGLFSLEQLRKAELSAWRLCDLPWDRIDRDLATPTDVAIARGLCVGESNSVAALHLFLNESTDDYDFGAFAAIWCVEELKHHTAFRTWLERMAVEVSQESIDAMRPAYPNGNSPAATIATNVISEMNLTTYYRVAGARVSEPLLGQILTLASEDEARHAVQFTHFACRRLERHPEELGSVLETLYVYLAEASRALKHPVSVLKGDEELDAAFASLEKMAQAEAGKLRQRILAVFSSITHHKLEDLTSVRRVLRQLPAPA